MVNPLAQFFASQLRDHENLLSGGATSGHDFVSTTHGCRDTQLKTRAPSADPCNDPRCDGLNLRVSRKNLQPWDQALHVGTVRNDQTTHDVLKSF